MTNSVSRPYQPTHAVEAIRLGATGKMAFQLTVAEEVAVAFRYNGFPHAVMMSTPADLEDFAYGFTLTEGLISDADGIRSIALEPNSGGVVAHVALEGGSLHRFLCKRRIRNSTGNSGCGICGLQDLVDLCRPLLSVSSGAPPSNAAIDTALNALREFQPLSRGTRGAHASAWVDTAGRIVAIREDVGRHNSLDKLIGAGIRGSFDVTDGFCLITSRCSYEMVHKAVVAGFGSLVAVSAPTALAIRTASEAGLNLYSIAGGEGPLFYTPLSSRESAGVLES